MNAKQIGLSVVLAVFSLLTGLAIYEHGLVGWFETLLSTVGGTVVLVDLVIALSLFLAWMTRDARDLGISPLPYFAVTLCLGSVGALLYLIRREGRLAERERPAVRVAAA